MEQVRNLGKLLDTEVPGDKIAVIDVADWERPVAVSYAALDALIDAATRGLLNRGLKPGDRVGILALNRIEYLAAYLAIMRGGFVAVPISIKLPRETIAHIVADAELAAVFHDGDRTDQCPPGVPRIGLDDGGWQSLLDPGSLQAFVPRGRDLAMILYTSGSTGMPKGVLLSHASQLWGLETARAFYSEDMTQHRYVVAAPLFHMNATFSVKFALMTGGSMVLMPAFDARRYVQSIPRFGVTWLTSVPTMLALVAREKDLTGSLDLSGVRRVMMGSAPLTPALVDKVQALFPQAAILNSYGTTEAGPVVCGPHPDGRPRPPTAIGYPAPASEMELREGPGPEEGVLYMRNPSHMEGYRNLPAKTAEVMRDGWYRSGDIMRRDADGFLHFLGRADDMFVCGGENVWPGEVEKMIERMDGVHQCLVVSTADEIKGALPFAFVVARPGAILDEPLVKAFALANGPAYAHPRHVEFVPEIPLAATNKPDRRLLTERAAEIAQRRSGSMRP